MGRSLFAEERLQGSIEQLYICNSWSVGLIIGQLTENQKDHAIHMVTTPLQDQHETAEENKPKKTATLETVDEFLLTSHVKQVCNMLPGGLSVIGIFVCAPSDGIQQAQMKLKQLLYCVHKEVERSRCLLQPHENAVTERYLLQICHTSRKLTCRTFDAADNKSGARPAEWKYQSSLDRWHQITTTLSCDFSFEIPVKDMDTTLTKQIKNGLSPLCSSVQNAVTLVDEKFKRGSELLDPSSGQPSSGGGKKGKKQRAAMYMMEQASVNHTAEMYIEMPCPQPGGKSPCITDCGAKMLLRGSIHGRAFVNAKATIEDATKALKDDIIRSLYSRCQLLCEDLLQAEEEQDTRVLYEMPVRVFASLPGSFVCLCDYMFQDEASQDSIDRFKELVDLVVTEDSLEVNCERIPNDDELEKPRCRSRHASEEQSLSQSKPSSPLQFIGAALGGVVAALAMGMSYLYLGQD